MVCCVLGSDHSVDESHRTMNQLASSPEVGAGGMRTLTFRALQFMQPFLDLRCGRRARKGLSGFGLEGWGSRKIEMEQPRSASA